MSQVHIDVEEGGDTGEGRYGGTPERLALHVQSPSSEMSSSSRCQRQMSDQDKMFQKQILNALDREYNAREGALRRSALFQGLLCIAAVVFLWVSASELIQYVFDSIEFNKPMFLTMYANALFSLYLLGFVFSAGWRSELHRSYRMCFAHTPSAHSCEPQEYDGYESDQDEADEGRPLIPHGKRRPKAIPMALSGGGGTGHRATPASKIRVGGMIDEMDPISENRSFHASLQPSPVSAAAPAVIEARERVVAGGSVRSIASVIQEEDDNKSTVLAPHQIASMALVFAPIWLAAGYAFNLSLCARCQTGTSVASNTVISSTTSLWALLMSVVMLGESASVSKLAAVVLSCIGAGIIASDDKGESSLTGDLLALFSAVGFGLTSVLIKWYSPSDDAVNYPMFFGFLGLFHSALAVPCLFVLDAYGIETFQPLDQNLVACLTINGIFGTVLSNVLWARAISFTSPLTVNLGTSTSIPLSFLADYLNPTFSIGYFFFALSAFSMNVDTMLSEILNRHAHPPNLEPQYLLGTVMVLGSFIFVSILEGETESTEAEAEWPQASNQPLPETDRKNVNAVMGGAPRMLSTPSRGSRSNSILSPGDFSPGLSSPLSQRIERLTLDTTNLEPDDKELLKVEVRMMHEENARLRETIRRGQVQAENKMVKALVDENDRLKERLRRVWKEGKDVSSRSRSNTFETGSPLVGSLPMPETSRMLRGAAGPRTPPGGGSSARSGGWTVGSLGSTLAGSGPAAGRVGGRAVQGTPPVSPGGGGKDFPHAAGKIGKSDRTTSL